MLVEFSVANFLSFRDEQRLSLVTSDKHATLERAFDVPALGKERLLRSAVIYGPNASGKSNLFKALAFVKSLITNSFNRSPDQGTGVQPFRLAQSTMDEPSVFDLTFIQDGTRYDYHLVADTNVVHDEVLYAHPRGRAQRWFHRRHDPSTNRPRIDLGPGLKGRLSILHEAARPNLPVLALAILSNNPQLMSVYRWFDNRLIFVSPELAVGNNFVNPRQLVNAFVAEQDWLHQPLSGLLRMADVGIRNIEVREDITFSVTSGEAPELISGIEQGLSQRRQKYVQFLHAGGEELERDLLFSMEEESHGTQELFVRGTFLLLALQQGNTLVVDELDASLHPQLVRALVELFHRENPSNAQLIFNTHDASLLRGDLFDRDQIWFIEKDRQGESRLYPLLDFREQPGEDLERGYLRGRYGAVPLIDRLTWEELRPDAAAS